MTSHVQLGSVGFQGQVLPYSLSRQTPPSLQTGPAIQRSGRQGVVSLVFDDFSKGFYPISGVQNWAQNKGRVYYNEGVMLHMPGLACLPYKSTAQTTLAAVDISGYRALNRRVHAIMSSLGSSSGGRFYAFLGPNMYKDTSTSSPALTAPATADNLSDNVCCVWAGRANATDYLIIGTDGQSEDTEGTTDPTADSVNWIEIVTHANSADRIEAGWYFPQWDINVFMGTLNNTQGMWSFPGGAATLPYTSSTVTSVVYTDTKDVANANASTVSLTAARPRSIVDSGIGLKWTNLTNILGNSAFAEASTNGADDIGFGVADFGWAETMPTTFIPTGVTVTLVVKESNAAADAYVIQYTAIQGGVPDSSAAGQMTGEIGFPKVGTLASNEFAVDPSTSTLTFGGSSDKSGAELTATVMRRADFGFAVTIDHANVAQTVYAYDFQATAHGKYTGTSVQFPKGCHGIGPNPASATQRLILAPTRSEATAVTVEREPWILNFAFDSDGNRVTCQPTKVAAGMAHTEDAFHHQGGYILVGGSAPGPAELAKIADSNGVVRSIGFPQVNGSTAVRITSGVSANTAAMFWVCNADSTDAQLWIFVDGSWNAYGALFSKTLGGAMSTTPIAYAERTMGTTNKFIYNFYPSSTNTAVVRQFVPTDVLTDPRLTNTSQVKQDGPLYFQGLMLDIMPEEALKAFTGMELQTQYVDDNTAYGSVKWAMDVLTATGTAATAITTNAINETFDAANESYRLRSFSTNNDPGVAFKAAQPKCTLDHEAGTAETPNGLPAIFYISANWPYLQRGVIYVAKEGQKEGPVALQQRLLSTFTTKPVQRLSAEGQQLPVALDVTEGKGIDIVYTRAYLGLTQPTWNDVEKFLIYWQEVEGAIA